MIPKSAWWLLILLWLTGCAGWNSRAPSPAEAASPSHQQSQEPARTKAATDATVASHVPALARLGPEESYGVWLAEDGLVTTWIRLEKPRLRIVSVDLEKKIGWAVNGYYAFAKDGSVFAALAEVGQLNEAALPGLCWSDEKSLRGLPMDKTPRPFRCDFCADGDGLKIDGYRGATFHDARDTWQGRRYHKVAAARPGYAGSFPPLGNWEQRLPESHDRMIVHFLPNQIGVTMVDSKAGKRTRLRGECAAGPEGLIYGIFTTIDTAIGRDQPEPLAPPPLFCLRLGFTSNRLTIREVEGPELAEGTRSRLMGEYLPAR